MQKTNWMTLLVLAWGVICIAFGILGLLSFAGVIDLRDESDVFSRGNLLEKMLRIGISTEADRDQFKGEGGLENEDRWHGYRVKGYTLHWNNETGKLDSFGLDLHRESPRRLAFFSFGSKIAKVNDLKELLKPACSPNGEEWFHANARPPASDVYGTQRSKYPNLKYECAILDNPGKATLSVIIVLWKQGNPPSVPAPAPTPAASAPITGKVAFTLEARDYTYKLIKLAPQDAAQAFSLMATQPAQTTQHPMNANPIFKDAKIVQEPSQSIYQKTSLVIDGKKIFTSSPDDEKLSYSMEYLTSLDMQPDLLLIGVFEGGNSCDSQKQILFANGANGYLATMAFGRCGVSWFDDKANGATYFVYPANEHNPLEVMALTRTPH